MTRFIYLLICLIKYASIEPFNYTRLLAPVKKKETAGAGWEGTTVCHTSRRSSRESRGG